MKKLFDFVKKDEPLLQVEYRIRIDDNTDFTRNLMETILPISDKNVRTVIDLNADDETRTAAHFVIYVTKQTKKLIDYAFKAKMIEAVIVATQVKKVA